MKNVLFVLAVLVVGVNGICRFGDVTQGCALPCDCIGPCNQTTGACSGSCKPDVPHISTRSGPGCRIHNVAYKRSPSSISFRRIPASKAVDGHLSTYDTNCAQTTFDNQRSQRAWFYVDLGSKHKISYFTLVNKRWTGGYGDTRRKSLGKLYVGMSDRASTSLWGSNYACHNSDYEWANGGTRGFPCTTNNVGRYFFIYRKEHATLKGVLAVCEVILQGYEIIECGAMCKTTCNDLTGCDKCDPGYRYPDCKTACVPGRWGDNCEEYCSAHCTQTGGICNIGTGECEDCQSDWWGGHCDTPCSSGCHVVQSQVCDRYTGKCVSGCTPGGVEGDWRIGDWCNVTIPAAVEIQELKMSSSRPDSLIIQWRTNIPSDLSQHYGFSLDIGNGVISKDFDTSITLHTHQFTGLKPDTSYTISISIYRVAANGTKFIIPQSKKELSHRTGSIPTTVPDIMTTTAAGPQTPISTTGTSPAEEGSKSAVKAEPGSGPPVAAIAGGAVGGIIVILAGVFFLLFLLIRRGKIKWPRHNRQKEAKDEENNNKADKHKAENGADGGSMYERPKSQSPYEEVQLKPQNPDVSIDDEALKQEPGPEEDKEERDTVSPELPSKMKDEEEEGSADETLYGNTTVENSCVKVAKLERYIQKKEKEGGLNEEFFRLKRGFIKPITIGTRESKMQQNRYRNIVPYDETRVHLKGENLRNDYINASYVRGVNKKDKTYIACQGPNPLTINHMWLMIWESKASQVAMVTECIEGIKVKCELYWPDKLNLPEEYGDITVTQTEAQDYACFTIRTLKVNKDKVTRTIRHYHYHNWPDKTPPENAFDLLHFRDKIRSGDKKDSGPLIVHCSAGVGRTGTLIALDILLDMMEKEGKVDVFNVVNELRNDRMNMVQTPLQYSFIYHALLDRHKTGNTSIPGDKVKEVCQDMKKDDGMYTNETKIEALYKLLQNVRKAKKEDTSGCVGKEYENENKNRDPEVIPSDDYRVELRYSKLSDSDYINAVFIPTYAKLKGLIVTQVPMKETVGDFWSMVLDYKCSTIVSIISGGNKEEEDSWCPEESAMYEDICIDATDKTEECDVHTKDLKVAKKDDNCSLPVLPVRVIKITWDDSTPVPEVGQVLAVLDMMDTWQAKTDIDGPHIIMCRNGAKKSGLIAASVHVRQRFRMDADVDIMHSVRVVSAARPQFISSIEQFALLYELAADCTHDGDLYANVQ